VSLSPSAGLAFNSFGLDTRSGMDRYGLLPASGTAIIRSKNLAFVIIMSAQVLPLILLSGWRSGLLTAFATVGSSDVFGHSVHVLGKLDVGDVAVADAFLPVLRRQPGRSLEIIAGVTVNSLPGVLILYLIRAYGDASNLVSCPHSPRCVLSYFVATIYLAARFEMTRQRIRDSLG
jgi:hypothetical protein